jgi:HEAT repeat protein
MPALLRRPSAARLENVTRDPAADAVALAGHRGDEATVRAGLRAADPRVRVVALGALARLGHLEAGDLGRALADPDPAVRRRAAEEAGRGATTDPPLVPLLGDPDPTVVEAVAWACGERRPVAPGTVAALSGVALDHEDPLCREAAVAALGAIGDEAGLEAILAATADKPAVRRRAVIALAPFEGLDVDAALQRALEDRDRQVRQAAEDLVGP